MKIGLLTYYEGANFGVNLQVYSSSRYLDLLGHEVWVIKYSRDKKEYDYSKYPYKQVKAHSDFIEKKLNLTERLGQDELYGFVKNNNFDVIALGADAIWNKRDKVDLKVYTAQWLKNEDIVAGMKVIGISPAFMGSTYSDLTVEEKESFKAGLLRFTYPNTRDEWTRSVVNREIMGFEYIKKTNPDPVFLLNELCIDKWNPLWDEVQSKKYFIISIPPTFPDKSSMLSWLKKLKQHINIKGYKLIELPMPEGASGFDIFDYTVPYPIDPLQWFLWLKNARGYIGMRFHAVVSCLSAGTPFFSLDIYGNVPRWLDYLNRLGIHRFDRQLNKRSKIRNLLEGSGLEDFRMNGIYVDRLNPKRLIDKLESCDTRKIIDFRDKNIAIFKKNMDEALNGPLSVSNK